MHRTPARRLARFAALLSLPALLAPATARAQADDASEALTSWVALDAPIAHEQLATDRIARAIPGWERDPAGNLVLRRGSGSPRRVIACGIDRPGYAVTQITADGYLRLHRVGSVSRHPLWDQSHEGQQVRLFTPGGEVPGVVAIANGHFAQQHRADTVVVTADMLWVDVGATSAAGVERLGIRLLDPVARSVRAWPFAGQVAGADAGARAGCAALAAAAGGEPATGETVFLVTPQSAFGWVGLGSAVARLGRVDELTILDRGRAEGGSRRARIETLGALAPVLRAAGLDSVRMVAPTVRHAGALMETISLDEAARLRDEVWRAAGMRGPARGWVEIPPGPDPAAARDSLSELASLLGALAELPGVPGHEWRVRDAVRAALPAWARAQAVTDSAGSLVLAMGPDRDTTVFIAHMDEVAYEVTAIAPDGTVTLGRRGGAIASAWEGQPALLHFDPDGSGRPVPPSLPGVFVSRDAASSKAPRQLTAWFGMDSTALAARGVGVGAAVTAQKEAVRIGEARLAARALDDRAGTTALLMAVRRIDPARLPGKAVFVWSVREEGGLVGARVVAERLRTSVRRVYSIDTFVSSDTPLESPHFAHAPLGSGPVLRAIENSSIATPAQRARVQDIARAAGIPLQIGMTQGGTDGTVFTFWGAPNAGLSWPGRYSHTPGEVLDLRDLAHLVDLIVAVAGAPN